MVRESWYYEPPEGKPIGHVAMSGDGGYIVAAAWCGDIYLFRRTNSKPIWIYRTLNGNSKVVISSSGQTIAAFTHNGDLMIFNNTSSNPIWTTNLAELIPDPKMYISTDGKRLLVGDNLINIASFLFLHNFSAPSIMTADGKYILTIQGPQNPQIFLTDTTNFSTVLSYNYTGYPIKPTLSISSNGNHFVIGSHTGTIYFYNKTNATPLWNYTGYGPISDIEMSASGNEFTAVDDRNIYFFQMNSPVPVWNHKIISTTDEISISSDGNYIVALEVRLALFHRSSPVILWRSIFYGGSEVAISHNGNYFATASTNLFFISRTNPQIITDYVLYFIWLFGLGYTISIIIISIISSKMYKKSRERKRFEKFKSLIKESDQIEVEKIYSIFKKEYDRRTFYRKIFEWASEFNFTLDGETLLLKEGSIADFIKLLDEMFIKWEQEEKEKT